MAIPLSFKKREQLFRRWLDKRSIQHVARTCSVSKTTAHKYRRVDKWVSRARKIERDSQKRADTKAKQEFQDNLEVAEHVKRSYLAQLLGRVTAKCEKCGAVVSIIVPRTKAQFRDILGILEYIDEKRGGDTDDKPKLVKSPLDITKLYPEDPEKQ